jgi:quinohemoprotein ethanol dehydrogenase
MKYHELENVVTRPGLRLILTESLPGPWGLAARALFDVKGIDYLAAAQRPDQDNQLLAELTGQTSAPVALYNDEGVDLQSWEPSFFEGDTMAVGWAWSYEEGLPTNTLQARDPVSNRTVWEIPMPGMSNPGTLTTAGNLVFQGRVNGELYAYDATSGDVLWTYPTGLGISAPPVTYSADGKQYIAVLVGWGGGAAGLGGKASVANGWAYGAQTRRLVAFSLEGAVQLPVQPAPAPEQPIEILQFEVDPVLADAGAGEFGRCVVCHGFDAISPGMAPDLRASPLVAWDDAFAEVVSNGARMQNGMPRFRHLSDEQLLKIRHYLRREAEKALADSP